MLTKNFTRRKGLIATVNGKAPPPHLKGLRIPPAWTDVSVDPDPEAKNVASGLDEKGRLQRIYSKEWTAFAKQNKFERIDDLLEEMDNVEGQIYRDVLQTEGGKAKDAAVLAYLIFTTGIRPGSNSETLADKKAFGATTLRAGHVKPAANGVRLQFVGKKGVKQNVLVTDKTLVRELTRRKKAAGVAWSTPLFDVSPTYLNGYIATLGSGGYTAKDFRTMRGTHLALKLLGARKKYPKSDRKLKAIVNNALDKVARQLGNTRAVSRTSYVNPVIIENILARKHPGDV